MKIRKTNKQTLQELISEFGKAAEGRIHTQNQLYLYILGRNIKTI